MANTPNPLGITSCFSCRFLGNQDENLDLLPAKVEVTGHWGSQPIWEYHSRQIEQEINHVNGLYNSSTNGLTNFIVTVFE